MFLRSLTLKGFKSFADATTLEFEPGVTVVVGPNGSGKSNVVDAVAWVLGAQGPRSVRSSKMDDVIFAGSSRRPALGRAEVTLTIDNSMRVLPIDFTEVTITRTLFRESGESEYALNGVPCRLLDVQELLSDTGVGRQQHVIVSQGNLDSVLDARPEDRRLIIEEAAGILKFRRRKEKAQRRLDGSETNLVRLGDLLREVRRQLRPLERQADAARRHGALAEELRALRLYVSGRELAALGARTEGTAAERGRLGSEETALRSELKALDGSVAGAEQALSRLESAGLGEVVARLEALRERARGLRAVLVERQRSVEQQLAATVDQTLVAALEADAERLAAELADVEEVATGLPARFEELAAAEAELAHERSQVAEAAVRLDRAAEVRGELTALRTGVDRGRAEQARLENRLAALGQRGEELAEQRAAHSQELEGHQGSEQSLVAGLAEAEADRAAALAEVERAQADVRAADASHQVWAARAEALSQTLEESLSSIGTGPVGDVAGVVGTLRELVEVDAGWEAAFEAAAAEALGAVVVDGIGAARQVLSLMDGSASPATVLPPAGAGGPGPPPAGEFSPPPGFPGEPLRSHVKSPSAHVERWLDSAMSAVMVVDGGWTDALDMALAHPDIVVVTRQGDRFGARGWRVGLGRTAITAAALEEATRQAQEALISLTTARSVLAEAGDRQLAAEARWQEMKHAVDEARARTAESAVRLERVDAALRELTTERDALAVHLHELAERLSHEVARVAELEASMPALEEETASEAMALEARRAVLRRVEEKAEAVNALRTELEVRAAGLEERRRYLRQRSAEVEQRLERSGGDRAGARARRQQLELLSARTAALSRVVADRIEELDSALHDAQQRRQRHAEASARTTALLRDLRTRRSAAERRLEEVRERARRAELEEAEARMRMEAAVEALRRELECEPDTAITATCPELPAGTSAPSRIRELERELRLMGPINPLALEELAALEERHTFLTGQLDDIRTSRRELTKVIRAVDAEMRELLAAACADVADNFVRLFGTLFPGGHGRLRFTDPDNLLETGIEIEARPFGKNVRKLSLLSGGERSLCALAFLFAVFRSRPSPFYLLDEVEAALDDVNLHRFLELLHEFRQEAQLVVVSHQKRTMEAADCLYGVTMQPGGSSKVLSERLRTPA